MARRTIRKAISDRYGIKVKRFHIDMESEPKVTFNGFYKVYKAEVFVKIEKKQDERK